MSEILPLVRPAIRALKPYVSARSLTVEGSIFLDANESPRPLSDAVAFKGANRYPEPQPRRILETASAIYGASRENILVGRGSDEGIDLLTRAFCEAGRDQVLICPPTYGVYETAADIQGAGVVRVPLVGSPGFRLDVSRICAALADPAGSVKLVYICSPNNPTGGVFEPTDIVSICTAARGRALVVVDEAYLEFSGRASMISRLGEFPNLVVLRTLSKAWALAGVRCGFVFADPEVIAVLQRLRAPYPISSASIAAVEAAFSTAGREVMERSVAGILAARAGLLKALGRIAGVGQIFPTDANFVLVRVKDRPRLSAVLKKAGIVLRDRSFDEGLLDCIRITVGTAEENGAVVACFEEALG